MKGTGICRVLAIPLEGNAYRYSMRVKCPSGGTKVRTLSRDHFCNLTKQASEAVFPLAEMTGTSHKGGRSNHAES